MTNHSVEARLPGLADRLRQSRFWLLCTGFWLVNGALLIVFQHQRATGNPSSSLNDLAMFVLLQELPALLLIPLLIAAGTTILRRARKTTLAACLLLFTVLFAVGIETLVALYSLLLPSTKLVSLFIPQLTTLSETFSWYLTQDYLQSDLQKYLFCLAVSVAIYWQENDRHLCSKQQELKNKLQINELALQRAQLNPHFVFNSLNSIAALVRTERSPQALKAISELSLLLREILANRMQEFCTLESELHLITHYIHLQKLRFGEKLQFNLEVVEQAQHLQIPTLLLLSLTENAIKHGARSLCQITLSISVSEKVLNIQLHNTIDEQQTQAGFGIGLSNNHKRLELLYQTDFKFETRITGDEFEVLVELPATAYQQ